MTVNEANNIVRILNELLESPDIGGRSGNRDEKVMDVWRFGIRAAGTNILLSHDRYSGMEPGENGDRFKLPKST